MWRWRVGIIVALIISGVWLAFSVADNPLFFVDISRAIRDIQLELSITTMLVILLLWAGIEVNHRSIHRPVAPPMRGLRKQLRHAKRGRLSSTQLRWVDFWQGISTELIGAVISAVVLGMIVLIFQQYSAIQNRKAELILQMGSDERVWAVEAVRQLDVEGWLSDGALNNAILSSADLANANLNFADLTNADFRFADLTNANLRDANLTNAILWSANLTNADLRDANLTDAILSSANLTDAYLNFADLTNADLRFADLTDAILSSANLTDAYLNSADLTDAYFRFADLANANLNFADLANATFWFANLTNADLRFADLMNADLRFANLTDADLVGVIYTENTTLPDGTNWTSNTDMTRFTNPEHHDFWNPCVEVSPPARWYCE